MAAMLHGRHNEYPTKISSTISFRKRNIVTSNFPGFVSSIMTCEPGHLYAASFSSPNLFTNARPCSKYSKASGNLSERQTILVKQINKSTNKQTNKQATMSLLGQSGLLPSDEDLLLARNWITLILWYPTIEIHCQMQRKYVFRVTIL